MRREEQFRRDLLIAIEFSSGSSQKEIGARVGVSERTVRRAIRRVRSHSVLTDSIDELGDYLLRIEGALEELAHARAEAGNPRTRVAAIRAQLELLQRRVDLIKDLGIFSTSSGEFSR